MPGQFAILAGASRGIGRAIALALARRGVHCCIFGQSTVKEVADACAEQGPAGLRCAGFKVDLRDKKKVSEAIQKVLTFFGTDRLDVLVQSASVHRGGDISMIEERGYDFVQKTNLMGTSNIVHMCMPFLQKSEKPQMLFVAPAAVSAHSWLMFARGSTVYCSAKLMMGFYLELWKKAYPTVGMSTLWPKYVVKSAATDVKQGSNKHLQADELQMVEPIFMGEAAALALARPMKGGRADFHLDADIHETMGVPEAREDFLVVPGRPWDELEVCFQVEVTDPKDVVKAYDVSVPALEKAPKTLIVGAFRIPEDLWGLDAASIAVVNCAEGGDAAIEGYEQTSSHGCAVFTAPTAGGCAEAVQGALEYLGDGLEVVLFACDVSDLGGASGMPKASAAADLEPCYERLNKLPFFACKALKQRLYTDKGDAAIVPQLVYASAPPDVHPLGGCHVTLNEVLLDRALIALAIASEFERDGVCSSMRLCWTASFRAPASAKDMDALHATCVAAAAAFHADAPPTATCAVVGVGKPYACALAPDKMSRVFKDLVSYSAFPTPGDRRFWFPPIRKKRPAPALIAAAPAAAPLPPKEAYVQYLGESSIPAWSEAETLAANAMPGQFAILAGASRGIGRAIALALARRGVHCCIFGQSTVKEVADACAEQGPAGLRCAGFKVDLRDKKKVSEAIQKVLTFFGTDRLDVLVQSASVHRGGDISMIEERGYDFVQKTNLMGTSNIVHMCMPFLQKSEKPQMLFVAPAAVSAHSWLMFARGSTVYCSAKLMMGFYLELWKKAYPTVGMSTLWPKYVVKSAATDVKQGSNKHLQADELQMVEPIFMGEAAALALARPMKGGRADFHLDADIHETMGVPEAREDFLVVPGRPWDELEVCFQVEVTDPKDVVKAYDVSVPALEKAPKTLIVGAFRIPEDLWGLDAASIAVVNCAEGGDAAIEGYEQTSSHGCAVFTAPTAGGCAEAVQGALEYLGDGLEVVLFACDVSDLGGASGMPKASAAADLEPCYERLNKLPFFACKALKQRLYTDKGDAAIVPQLVYASAPPDVHPLGGCHVTLNEVLLDRALIALAIASEFERDGVCSSMRLCWTASFRAPASAKDMDALHATCVAAAAAFHADAPPTATCAVVGVGKPYACALAPDKMSRVFKDLVSYSAFPTPGDRALWFPRQRKAPPPAAAPGGFTKATPAVLGLRALLPGVPRFEENGTALRQLLMAGHQIPATVPAARWETPVPRAEHSAIYGSFLDDAAADYEATGMVAVEARYADPQQLLVLESSCGSLKDALGEPGAAFEKEAFAGRHVAVYMGCGGVCYGGGALASASSIVGDPKLNLYTGTSWSLSVVSGRVSFVLGLTGPCLALDTACCSALVAAHVATGALSLKECDQALAATVGLLTEPASTAFSIAGMISPRGRCHTLDAQGDGYVRGEGCVTLVLDPEAENGAQLAGSATMQDGLSASLTAPNGSAQRRLLKAVPSESDYDGAVESLEMHGTGTALGDPIEVGAAANTLCGKAKNPARATSLKAIMGHLESGASGAGVVSLAATSLVRKPMPPNPLLKRLNGHLGSFLKQHPFAPPVEPTLATEDDVLGARLSSFGFSGTIAHARFSPAMDDADDRLYGAAPAQPHVAAFRSRAPCFPQLDAVRRGQCHRRSARTYGAEAPRPRAEHEKFSVAKIVNEVMGGVVPADKPLMDHGLDSFVVGELMDRFAKALGNTELPPTLLFDYPTVNALQKFLGEGAVVKDRKIVAKVDKGGRGKYALLIGADMRTPVIGDGFSGLRHLAACHGNGGNAVQFLPLHRRDEAWSVVKDYPVGATYGGFLSVDDVEHFAMDDFALTKAESKGMDPQQRLALEVGARALRDEGGYSLEAMVDADIGSYVGVQTSDFYDLARRPDSGVGPTYLATGANHAVASGRLPYVLGLRGASASVTTACSTALVCCHLARGGLDLSSTSEAALVVAVNLNLLAAMTVGVAKAGMLSTKGQCHTLDELADGYVRSEGCAGLLLIDEKKASPVDARLAASAVRSDGVSASLTAPSGLAQQELLREALSDARSKNPGHVELHGTGTALGDPIEIGALAALKSAEHPTTTAVKANVGHSETCSGGFGLTVLKVCALSKAILAP